MDRKAHTMGWMIMLGIICAAVGIFAVYELVLIQRYHYSYELITTPLYNPMTGFAPNADYVNAVGENTLVYVDVTWKELEPEEGVYAFDAIASENYLERWKAEGKRVVFRFTCDEPGDEAHMDIPQWLYDKTGDGVFYDMEYGKGYAPDYNNPILIAAHTKAIAALGQEYGQDSFFCFIELGSLGHWGEWHVRYDEGLPGIPSADICRQYTEVYVSAFPNAKLLMRRPFALAKEYQMGIYNDMTGDRDATEEWLEWIKQGGIYNQTEQAEQLEPMPEVWKKGPVGGEFTSDYTMETMLTSGLEETLDLLEQSHMTFAGPNCPIANVENQAFPEAVAAVQSRIGYAYAVTQCSLKQNQLTRQVSVSLELTNRGTAPMYFDWPVYLYVYDEQGQQTDRILLDVKLSGICQNDTQKLQMSLSGDRIAESIKNRQSVRLGIGIEDPDTGIPAVQLYMDTEQKNHISMLN